MRTQSHETLLVICMIAATFVETNGAQGDNATFAEKLGIPFANSRVYANGISLEYESIGGPDREVVLLVMGTGGQLTQWPERLCQQLVRCGYRVITFDNRDCGHSTRFDAAGVPDWPVIFSTLASGKTPPLVYTLDDMTKDAVGLLDGLGIKRAHVVGISMGGSIAQMMAAQYPDRVLSLTSMMAGSGNPSIHIPAKPEVLAQVPPIVKSGDIDAIILREVFLWQTIASPAYPTSEPLIRKRVESYVRRAYYPAGIERQGAAIACEGDRRSQLKTIKAPTVVLHGKDDPLVPVEAARDVAESIPGAELRIIPGMGHEIPDALVGEVVDAITTAAARASIAK